MTNEEKEELKNYLGPTEYSDLRDYCIACLAPSPEEAFRSYNVEAHEEFWNVIKRVADRKRKSDAYLKEQEEKAKKKLSGLTDFEKE